MSNQILYDIFFFEGMQVWTPIVPTGKGPTWREYYTATIVNNEIYVIGGHERNRVSSEMYQLQWSTCILFFFLCFFPVEFPKTNSLKWQLKLLLISL
jgi:hypothetical protein